MPALTVKGRLELVVRSPEGRVVARHRQAMHSFTMNIARLLYSLMSTTVYGTPSGVQMMVYPIYGEAPSDPSYAPVDVSGYQMTLDISAFTGYRMWCEAYPDEPCTSNIKISIASVNARAGDHMYGIVIGSGSKPYSPDDYSLEQKYDTTMFEYGDTIVSPPVIGTGSISFSISRQFKNITQAPLDIREVGLVAGYYWQYISQFGPTLKRVLMLIARDVLSSPVTVQPQSTVTAKYNIHFKL